MVLRRDPVTGKQFYRCTNYPNCEGTRPVEDNGALDEEMGE